MPSTVGKQRTEEEIIRAALKLEYDCVAAYESALQTLESEETRKACEQFIHDHRHHVTILQERAEELALGCVAANIITATLNKGKISFAGVFGDRAVIAALSNNETDSDAAFETVCNRPDVSYRTAQVFEELQTDAHAHSTWIHRYLDAG